MPVGGKVRGEKVRPAKIEEGPHDGEAGTDNADVAFDVDPDACVYYGPFLEGL